MTQGKQKHGVTPLRTEPHGIMNVTYTKGDYSMTRPFGLNFAARNNYPFGKKE